MRFNMFQDAYCHTSNEVIDVMRDKNIEPTECHADFSFDEETDGWIGEVRENEDGKTVCYLEGFTSAQEIRVTLLDTGIAVGDISEL